MELVFSVLKSVWDKQTKAKQKEQMGKLEIELLECRNLANKDIGSLSDPYVIFKLLDEGNEKKVKSTQKSQVIKDNLHPVFEEKFSFDEYVVCLC